jgi:deazaflavin-dependent oxidoreductase (nitroreductase family)
VADTDEWQRIKNHIKQFEEDPGAAHEWNPYGKVVTALLLTTIGRKTGKPRSRPLVYTTDGDNYVIVASMGGAPVDPAWYTNLMATPDVVIQIKDQTIRVHARTAEGDEREKLWKKAVAMLPQYEEYQALTSRQLPVIVLEPIAQQSGATS